MSKAPTRFEEFHALPPDRQLLLEYVSFVGRPLSKNDMAQQFRDYLQSIDMEAPDCESLISELASEGFLDRRGGSFSIAADILEEVSTHSALQGRVKQQCNIATSTRYPRPTESDFTLARRALYLGQTARLNRILERNETDEFSWSSKRTEPLPELFLNGICSQLPLDFFPQELAVRVAVAGLTKSEQQAIPVDHLFTWLDSYPEVSKDPQSHGTWVHQLMLRERPEIAPQLDFVAQSCRQILAGNLEGVDTLRSHLLRDQKPKSFDFCGQEFIYVIACYAQSFFEEAEERLRNGKPMIRRLLEWFWKVRTGRASAPCPLLQKMLNRSDYPPSMQFFHFLLLYFAGFESHLEPERVLSLATRYEDAGYLAWSRELNALSRYLAGETDALTPFLSLLRPTELWDATLTQLESWSALKKNARKEEPEERLVWILDLRSGRNTLIAKIQTMGKGHRWSKGRQVQIHELMERPDIVDNDDQRVISAWALRERYSFGRQGRSKLMATLVGHPRLFDSNENSIQLVFGEPRLLVSEDESSVSLQLLPKAIEPDNFAIQRVAKARYELVIFDSDSGGLAKIFPEGGLTIPSKAHNRVQAVLRDVSEDGIAVESCLSAGDQVRHAKPKMGLIVRLYSRGFGLSAEAGFEPLGPDGPFYPPGHGERFLLHRLRDEVVEVARDLEKEWELFEQMAERVLGFQGPESLIANPRACLEMLEDLRALPQEMVTIQWPEGETFAPSRVLGWSNLKVAISKKRDWFAVKAELEWSEDEQLELGQLLEKNRRQGSRFIKLDDGSYISLTRNLEKRLRALELASKKQEDGTFLLNSLTSAVLFSEDEVAHGDEAWQAVRAKLKEAREVAPVLSAGFQGELRPYQREGYDWLVRSAAWGVGVCLADDMGLGKTVQILALLLQRGEGGPALVVAPTSVCTNWKQEAARFAPGLTVTLFGESDRDTVVQKCGPNHVLVCSYGLVCRNLEQLKEQQWHSLVLDESQAIKNTRTKRFKAATALEADFRVAATGTPVENHLSELWALFQYLNPGLLGTQKDFLARYSKDDDSLENLKQLVSPFLLRRLKKDVLKELPPKTDVTLHVELSRKQKLFYESLRLRAVEKIEEERAGLIGILAELMRLRRACCHPILAGGDKSLGSSKLDLFLELVADLKEAGHRALVFSQFVDHLKIVAAELDQRGLSYQYLDGSTPSKKRTQSVKDFQEGEGDLFLISLKAGGTGLNLTAANYVVHLDPWWNPATEDQASDRAHRIGQERAVTVYRLIGKDTIEEKILALHAQKREMVDTLLSGSDKVGKLSSEELLNLLRESALR